MNSSLQHHLSEATEESAIEALSDMAAEISEFIASLSNAGELSLQDYLIISGPIRHAGACIDGLVLCSREHAVLGAAMHLRSLFEASLYTQWMIERGKDYWPLAYFVHGVRLERMEARALLEGRPEYTYYLGILGNQDQEPNAKIRTEALLKEAEQSEKRLDEFLAGPPFDIINKEFESLKNRFPRWFEVGEGGVRNVAAMAEELGRKAEYHSINKFTSERIHPDRHRHNVEREKPQEIRSFRDPQGLPDCLLWGIIEGFQTLGVIAKEYAPDDVQRLATLHRNRWILAAKQVDEESRL